MTTKFPTRSQVIWQAIFALRTLSLEYNPKNWVKLYEIFELLGSFSLQKETETECLFVIVRASCFCLFGELQKKYDPQIIDEIFQNLIFLWGVGIGQTEINYDELENLSLFR